MSEGFITREMELARARYEFGTGKVTLDQSKIDRLCEWSRDHAGAADNMPEVVDSLVGLFLEDRQLQERVYRLCADPRHARK